MRSAPARSTPGGREPPVGWGSAAAPVSARQRLAAQWQVRERAGKGGGRGAAGRGGAAVARREEARLSDLRATAGQPQPEDALRSTAPLRTAARLGVVLLSSARPGCPPASSHGPPRAAARMLTAGLAAPRGRPRALCEVAPIVRCPECVSPWSHPAAPAPSLPSLRENWFARPLVSHRASEKKPAVGRVLAARTCTSFSLYSRSLAALLLSTHTPVRTLLFLIQPLLCPLFVGVQFFMYLLVLLIQFLV